MSKDPDQQILSSSSSSSTLTSTAPRIQSSGLVSFSHADTSQSSSSSSPSVDRLRLPPLSSLISSGSSHSHPNSSPLSSPHTTTFYPNQEWSPSKVYPSASTESHQATERDLRGSQLNKSEKYSTSAPKGTVAVSQSTAGPLPSFRRSNSSTSTSTTTSIVNLPPLNALHIRHTSHSPQETPVAAEDKDRPRPPRIPLQAPPSRHRPESISSQAENSIGPIRRRYTGESFSTTPYSRPSPPSEVDQFNHIWEIYSYACRVNDDAAGSMRHTYPAIGHSDLKMLLYHFNRELERLDQYNPRLSNQLAQDAGLLHPSSSKIIRHRSPLSSPSTSTTSSQHHYHHQHQHPHPHQHQHQHQQSQQPHSAGWMSIPKRSPMERVSPHRDSSYQHSEYAAHHRRASPGESHSSSSGSVVYTTPALSYRSLQASPRPIHHPSSYSLQQYPISQQQPPHYHHHHHQHPHYQQQGYSHSTSPYAHEASQPFSNMNTFSSLSSSLPPKRVRKRKDELEQSCLSCSATETPEWRKGPTGPRTLCNACGLLFAKQCRKRELDAQARGERPKGSRPIALDIMSMEEKERSLTELRMAVNARATNGSPPI